MHALLIGATGATGKDLLQLLLNDNAFEKVDIFVRRDPNIQHPKLQVHIVDFDHPEQWSNLVQGDVAFTCMGTTLKAAGSKAAQWKIDYEYQYQFAKAARFNNVPHFVLVSATMASPDSRIFYSKMKGQLEAAIGKLAFNKLSIFKPPVLQRKETDRSMEVISIKAIRFLNKLGFFKAQKPLPTEVLAQAMINLAKSSTGVASFEPPQIWEAARV